MHNNLSSNLTVHFKERIWMERKREGMQNNVGNGSSLVWEVFKLGKGGICEETCSQLLLRDLLSAPKQMNWACKIFFLVKILVILKITLLNITSYLHLGGIVQCKIYLFLSLPFLS